MEQEIREALEKATPGPWHSAGDEVVVGFGFQGLVCQLYKVGESKAESNSMFINYQANTHLIANAPTYLEWCLSQIAELRKENERLQESNPQPKMKIGDMLLDRITGHMGKISDIQYEQNRYQFGNLSGWQYGIENLIKP